MEDTEEIKKLEIDYCKAANALSDYRDKNGYKPGARVIARWRGEPAQQGVIAPYGDAWTTVNYISVPVLLDCGVLQPWSISNLTVVTEASAEERGQG